MKKSIYNKAYHDRKRKKEKAQFQKLEIKEGIGRWVEYNKKIKNI